MRGLKLLNLYTYSRGDGARQGEMAGASQATSVTHRDLARFHELRGARMAARAAALLHRGDEGLLMHIDDRPVGHAWMCSNTTESQSILNGYFSAPPHSAFIHTCFVAAAYRGQGIFSSMTHGLALRAIESGGISMAYIDTETGNLPAQAGLRKAGFDLISKDRYVLVRGRRLAVWSHAI